MKRLLRIQNLKCIDHSRGSKIPIVGHPDSDHKSYLKFSLMPCNAQVQRGVVCEPDTQKIQQYFKKRPISFVWMEEHIADNSGWEWYKPDF